MTKPEQFSDRSRLLRELASLFSEEVIRKARQMDTDSMFQLSSAVAKASSQLLEAKGNPIKQRAIIKALPSQEAVALCKWLLF